VIAEYVVNNKIHSATKVSPFMVNYGKELRMGIDLKQKKSREGNGVCRKYKEDVRRESTREDKVTSK